MNTAAPAVGHEVAVGIDLGGTGTRFVALEASGNLVAHSSAPTPRAVDAISAVGFVADHIRTVAAGATVRSIGIGASGPIDKAAIIRNDETLPAFSNVDLVRELNAIWPVVPAIDNDAVTAAIYEATMGVARAYPSVLMLTLGTGVGVAALIGGEPVRGADGIHAEAGHLSLSGRDAPCYCGRSACLEQVASRSALQRSASALLSRPSGGPSDIQVAADRALSGDEDAVAMFADYGRGIAEGLSDLLTVYRSDCVVLGGSGATYFTAFKDALLGRMGEISTFAAVPPVMVSQAGDLGGAEGAAILGARRPDHSSWLSFARG